jgi:hypothetical protein
MPTPSLLEQARTVEAQRRTKGPKCRVCAFLASLPEDFARQVAELIAYEPRVSTPSIIDTLAANDIPRSEIPNIHTIDRHRRGECDPAKRPDHG